MVNGSEDCALLIGSMALLAVELIRQACPGDDPEQVLDLLLVAELSTAEAA